jgi:UDP-N-acetylmuramoylalanine--D-glutamate ligase
MTNLIASDQKRLIIGMGQTGLSCARFLMAKGLSFDLCDTRDVFPNQADVEKEFPNSQIFNGELDAQLLVQYQELVVSPGIAIAEPAIVFASQQGSRVRGDVDIFAEYVTKPIVAITGSNGKSTVTTLVGDILAAAGHKPAVCGNIGIPVLDVLLNDDDYHCYVVELSSFQLETTHHLAAEVACVLNICEDHMDRYASMMAYHQAKHRVFQGCRSIVTNREDSLTQPLVSVSMPKRSFGLRLAENAVAAKNQYSIAAKTTDEESNSAEYLMFQQQAIFPVAELKIKGRHNQLNALAAIALVESLPSQFDVSYEQLNEVLSHFTGLPHRCAWVAEEEGIQYFNDSKGTNVGSTLAAIEGLASIEQKNIVLIAGGVGKDQDFEPLADACQASVKQAVLFGRDARVIARDLKQSTDVVITDTLEQALELAKKNARVGDIILFSPACASFDQFASYVKRGEVFEQLIVGFLTTDSATDLITGLSSNKPSEVVDGS